MPPSPADAFDMAILRILERDNSTPQRKIGEGVKLSAPSVQRRIRRMEAEGVITANLAVVAPDKVGLPLTIFVQVELVSETPEDIDRMKRRFRDAPEVQQCWYVTGDADFVLVVTARDMADYEAFIRRVFFDNPNIRRFQTAVVMDRVKSGLGLPLG